MRSHSDASRTPRRIKPWPGQETRRRDETPSGHRLRTVEAISQLQRAAGNHAVAQLLLDGGTAVAGTPVVQRRSYGLDLPVSQNRYVNHAVTLWKTKPNMSLVDFADALLGTIAAELKGYGVPFFGWTYVSDAGAVGLFDSHAWKVKVNVSKFSSRSTATKLKDLTVKEVTEVVGTLYHESRHTDQDVLIIRSLLDQKKTVDEVFAATKIRKDVIKAVSTTKYSAALDPDQIAHARRMFDVMYGAHKEFLEFLMQHSAAVEALDVLAAPTSKLSAARSHLKVFGDWQRAVLQPKLKTMKAMTTPTPVETELLQRLQDVDAALTALIPAWQKVARAKKLDPADVSSVRQLAADAKDAIAETYVNLEGEQDAFRVEAGVKAEFTRQVAKP